MHFYSSTASVLSAGILVVGAGAAFAASDSASDATPNSAARPADGLGGGLLSTDAVDGVLGGLGVGL